MELKGPRQGKVWGETQLIEENPFCEMHRLTAKAGGICSKHIHQFKTNLFMVESGTMKVSVYQTDYDLVDETILEAGDWCKVPPNVPHTFEALTDLVAIELYWPMPIGKDIVRENVGKIQTSKDTEQLNG